VRSLRAPAKLSVATCLLLVLIGCSHQRNSAGAAAAPRPPSFHANYGQDASVIAAQIPGCSGVIARPVSAGATSSRSLVSTCTLRHHRVVIYGWPDPASESQAARLLATSPPSYSAGGPGWIQILGDDAPLDVQRSIATTVAAALGGTVTKYP
jgi:hypothetical protein